MQIATSGIHFLQPIDIHTRQIKSPKSALFDVFAYFALKCQKRPKIPIKHAKRGCFTCCQ